jgi:hypothetical protein
MEETDEEELGHVGVATGEPLKSNPALVVKKSSSGRR